MKKRRLDYLLLTAVIGLSGCTLEEIWTVDFMDENGNIIFCPKPDENGVLPGGKMMHLEYSVNRQVHSCHRDDCFAEFDCCGYSDKRAQLFYRAFEYGLCPSAMMCLQEKDSEDFYCESTQVRHCDPGYHVNGDACVPDTVNACGGIDCTKMAGWKSGSCSALGKCQISECERGYHYYRDEEGSEFCEADTIENCKEHGHACEKKEGERYVICNESAECEVTKCESNYHWNRDNNGCTINSVDECGWFNNNCGVMAGWLPGAEGNQCDVYNCIAGACKEGYHLYNQEVLGINVPCEINTNQDCGEHGNDCTVNNLVCSTTTGQCKQSCDNGEHQCASGCVDIKTSNYNCGACDVKCDTTVIDHSSRVTCENGSCIILECQDNYHQHNQTCELNSLENCGSHGVVCDGSVQHNGVAFSCNGGTCAATACISGYHIYEGSCERDGLDNCGKHDNACTTKSNAVAACINGKCQYTCNSGFGDCDNNMNNGCEFNLNASHMSACGSCTLGFASCDGTMNNGCEVELAQNALKSCTECADNYDYCGDSKYVSGAPFCINRHYHPSGDTVISREWCFGYCNNSGESGVPGISYKQCSPGQICYLKGSVVTCQ